MTLGKNCSMTRLHLSLGLAVVAGCGLLAGCQLLPEWSLGEYARRAHSLIRAHPWLYWVPGYAALAALVVQVTLPLAFPGLAGRTTSRASRAAFVLLTVATVVLLRWPGLAYGMEFNVDESATITNALTLLGDPRYWVCADGGTHGPLVELALLPVRLFGMQLDYGSARLVGLALMLGSVFFLFGALRSFFPEPISRAAVTPVTICIASLTHPDFLAYNAEHPAIFLLCAGAYGCARLAAGPAGGVYRRALASGLVLGLVPFAKLQAVPAGLTLAAVASLCLVAHFRGQGRKQLMACLALCAGGLAPAALVALCLCYQGLFRHFWICYIGSNLAYRSPRQIGMYDTYLFVRRWLRTDLSKELFISYFLATTGAGLLVVGLRHLDGRCWRLMLAGGAVLVAILYSIIKSGYAFNHYLLFLVFPLAYLAAVVLATLHETQLARAGRLALVSICLAWAVYIPSKRDLAWGKDMVKSSPQIDPNNLRVAELIRRYASPGEKLVVWGWEPQYHVLAGMPQGTLHNNTSAEIETEGNPFRDYFFQLYLQQLDRAKPPVFVDSVGPTSFEYRDRLQFAHENFPELRERIASRYELAGEVFGTRVYVSKERLAELSLHAPLFSEVPFPAVPAATNRVTWRGETAECSGEDSYLAFALKRPEFIQAIRLRFSYEKRAAALNPDSTQGQFRMRVYWAEAGRNEFTEQERFVNVGMRLESRLAASVVPVNDTDDAFREQEINSKTLTIPVNDTIDAFRVYPNGEPCAFKLEQVVLLVRPGDRARLIKEYENWEYEQLVQCIRRLVRKVVPPEAIVIVASNGDDELLELGGRKGWHFPRTEEGLYAGHGLADSATAVEHLEGLRAKGGQYLVIPRTLFWWLDRYKGLKCHLECYGRRVWSDEHCVIYQLSGDR